MTNKDVLKQYIDTGIRIDEYQMNKLNPSLLKTYLRKRIILYKHSLRMSGFEFDELNDGEYTLHSYEWKKLNNYDIINLSEIGILIPKFILTNKTEIQKDVLLNRIKYVNKINDINITRMRDYELDLIFDYNDILNIVLKYHNILLGQYYIESLNDAHKKIYFISKIEGDKLLPNGELECLLLYPDLFEKYIESVSQPSFSIYVVSELPENLRKMYFFKENKESKLYCRHTTK